MGSSLLETSESGPARGRGAASQRPAALAGRGLRRPDLCAVPEHLLCQLPLLWKELPGTPPACPLARFLSLVFSSFSSPFLR